MWWCGGISKGRIIRYVVGKLKSYFYRRDAEAQSFFINSACGAINKKKFFSASPR